LRERRQRHPRASFRVGWFLWTGKGVRRDPVRGFGWFAAADQDRTATPAGPVAAVAAGELAQQFDREQGVRQLLRRLDAPLRSVPPALVADPVAGQAAGVPCRDGPGPTIFPLRLAPVASRHA
jgi:hypothetical protein